jgi:hypothetical protein
MIKKQVIERIFDLCRQNGSLAACCACGFLRHFVPKNHDLWAAVNLWFNGVCKVKNRLIGDFLMFLREAQQTPSRLC